jgi:hypothetical protein
MDIAVNVWAVLGATVVSFIIGWLWYGPLFGKKWMALRKMDTSAMTGEMPYKLMAGEFVLTFITAYVLACFAVLFGATTAPQALELGFAVWVGFYATTLAGALLWEKMPMELYLIVAGRWLVSLLAMALVLAWPW